MSSSRIRLTHDAYRVGWITALPLEMATVIAMLDASMPRFPSQKATTTPTTLVRLATTILLSHAFQPGFMA
jgi:hypothetical protein